MWAAIAYETRADKKWMDLVPVEADRRLKDPEKIKADLLARTAKQEEDAAADPLRAAFVEGRIFFSDSSKTVRIKRASEVFGDLPRCSRLLVPDPGLFMRLGLLEIVCAGAPIDGVNAAVAEVRFGLGDGRCLDPGQLLFGRSGRTMPLLLLAKRLGMEDRAGFKEGATLEQRLHDGLDVIVRIGKQVCG